MAAEEIHIHLHGLPDHGAQLTRMETAMATAAEQIDALTGKVDGINALVGDIASDFEAFRSAMTAERENLTAAGQAALDAANAKADETATRLADLDVAIGDADGSDTPPVDPEA